MPQIPDAVDTVVCAPDDGWKYHPKHVEQFPYINILCNVASCWLYEYIGILLGAHPVFHISRVKVKSHRLIWFGHVQRMPDTRTVKKIFNWKPLTKRSQGRPKYRWEDNFTQVICQ